MISDRGHPEVIIPEAALDVACDHAVWALHLSAIEVMGSKNVRIAWNYCRGGVYPDPKYAPHWQRYNRVVRKLFVDAYLAGKYDELVADFTLRLMDR